jgi:dihydrofolate reductase
VARVVWSINVTVGGSAHHTDTIADEAHHQYASESLATAGSLLFGRRTFDLFAAFWPEVAERADLPPHVRDLGAALTAKPKYVLSSRAVETAWANTTWLRGPDLAAVRSLVRDTSDPVVVLGSPSLGETLVAADLVDELHVLMQPYLGAVTVRPFDGLTVKKRLSLLEARGFLSGVVLLRYALSAEPGAAADGAAR